VGTLQSHERAQKMKLTELEELSQLIYRKRHRELLLFLEKHNIKEFKILPYVEDNDRAILFYKERKIYIATAGSDDKKDWLENLKVFKTIKRLFYGFQGYAIPAEYITQEAHLFMLGYIVNREVDNVILAAHSRGDSININVFVQLREKLKNMPVKLFGWGFGGPGGGSWRFRKAAGDCNYIHFEIKGDPVHRLNFLAKTVGEVVKLPRQIHGFWNRIKLLINKGDMNHRSYDCIGNIEPWKSMNDIGEMNG